MQSLRSLFTIFKLVLIIVVMGLAGLLMVSVLPIKGNFKVLTVLSGSMEPTIPTGSVVVIKAQESYSAGDVVTFGRLGSKELVTHRISAVNYGEGDKTFVTKGDANNSLDPGLVTSDRIMGLVMFDIPYLGYVQNWLRTPTGFAVAVVLPAAILIYGELMTIKTELLAYLRRRKNIVIVFIILTSLGAIGETTNAYLSDLESVENNKIGVAVSYPLSDLSIKSDVIEKPLFDTPITKSTPDVVENVDKQPESTESGELNIPTVEPIIENLDTVKNEGTESATPSVNLNEIN